MLESTIFADADVFRPRSLVATIGRYVGEHKATVPYVRCATLRIHATGIDLEAEDEVIDIRSHHCWR